MSWYWISEGHILPVHSNIPFLMLPTPHLEELPIKKVLLAAKERSQELGTEGAMVNANTAEPLWGFAHPGMISWGLWAAG